MTVASTIDNAVALNSNSTNGQALENILKKNEPKYYLYVKCPNCHQDTTMVFHGRNGRFFNDYKEHLFDLYTCMKCKDTFAYNLSDKWLAEHREVA